MIVTYRLEVWNPKINSYVKSWEGREGFAEIMFNKPYNRLHTRRMIKITKEILYEAKASK